MEKYHKITTVFERDPATKYKTLIDGKFAKPEFEYLARNKWICTEKIDGTNIRVNWDKGKVQYGGRTDNAQIPVTLLYKLDMLFRVDLFQKIYPDTPMCLYGEGYGAKIQKGGGDYIPDRQDFILFDVRVGELWLERENVEDIALHLGIGIVPVIDDLSLNDAIYLAQAGFSSYVAEKKKIAEGLVMRPEVEMMNRRGERIITKIKYKDFQEIK